MSDFEKLGAFYLGREVPSQHAPSDAKDGKALLYDSKDLTTHALCVGMTGSGKTGLCISLLEEAAIDGIPAIVIDPKGDMGNLLLTFPRLKPSDFKPWIDSSAAARDGLSVEEAAKKTANLWASGLSEWGQDGDRIERLRSSVDMAIYTPGSRAGRPLSILKSFDVPPQAIRDDLDAMSERLQVSIAGLLSLIGVDSDPVQSREAILLSNVVQHAWDSNKSLDLKDLIHQVQKPPFNTLGVLDLETFYPSQDRFQLAMKLNGLLASPKFASWLEGEPLDVQKLLYREDGHPRISILSISHLSDEERMFFVTLLLGEVVTWMRTQSGTSSLRAILYMDEIFGYFPPTREPPSKRPMLTLLKQARAYGLGVVLATQNPVDLDYKGLGNTGTWFLGRLQTERDKQRVLDGLEGAMNGQGRALDRSQLESTLSSLGKRVFLMNNVHDDGPCIFKTRWALSYLRGPLSREETNQLARAKGSQPERESAPPVAKTLGASSTKSKSLDETRPVLPQGVREVFIRVSRTEPNCRLSYSPTLWCSATLHFVHSRSEMDAWQTVEVEADVNPKGEPIDWDALNVRVDDGTMDSVEEPEEGASFAALSPQAKRTKTYAQWAKRIKTSLYQTQSLTLFQHKELKLWSTVGEELSEFRVRVRQASKEKRDIEIDKLRSRYASKFSKIEEQIRKAEDRVGKEQDQYESKRNDSLLSIGGSLLGALLGRKKLSATNVRRASRSVKSASRVSKEKGDVRRAESDLATRQRDFEELEAQFAKDLEGARLSHEDPSDHVEETEIKSRKSDIAVENLQLVWLPYWVDDNGVRNRGFLVP